MNSEGLSLPPTAVVNDESIAFARLLPKRFEAVSRAEGIAVGRAWMLNTLFKQVTPPFLASIELNPPAPGAPNLTYCASWLAVQALAHRQLQLSTEASSQDGLAEFEPHFRRNDRLYRQCLSDARSALSALPPDLVTRVTAIRSTAPSRNCVREGAARPRRRPKKAAGKSMRSMLVAPPTANTVPSFRDAVRDRIGRSDVEHNLFLLEARFIATRSQVPLVREEMENWEADLKSSVDALR